VAGVLNLEKLVLPEDNQIYSINIEGSPNITSTNVDEIINKVYQSAVNYNIVNGHFALSVSLNPVEPYDLVGPPSAEALSQLYSLKGDYGWSIFPVEYFGGP
jgi:hypothetical protein